MNPYQQDYIFIRYKQGSSGKPERWCCLNSFNPDIRGFFAILQFYAHGYILVYFTALYWPKKYLGQ
ncbi:uncharacterized protein METZ01_LOCUS160314 [marine metagenome]|uniref:Uncharacterized protein n=1 Tax=marine metagenome TaxID=408172 RepID=A0A382B0W7_9ZZZZ